MKRCACILPVVIALHACNDLRDDAATNDVAPRAAPFTDVTEKSGMDFVHEPGRTEDFLLPEIMGGGGGFLDFDNDGILDIYLVQSGRMNGRDPAFANVLYRNLGNGRFEDVTATAGVGDTGYGMGCAAGDFDNDGDIDLYVTNLGPNVLYRNNGDGTFTDVTHAAGVGDRGWATSAAFVDYDADGDLDLFVGNYVEWADSPRFTARACYSVTGARDYCSPQAYDARSFDTLYRNEGDGTFTDVSAEAGIRTARGTALGIVCTDLDGDGRIDLYVSNDQMPSFAWINRGDGTFVERATQMGVAVDAAGNAQAGMGVDAADIDNDGDQDLWKVHLHRETHVLYLNEGGYFDDATAVWGIAAASRPYTGFGTTLFDYDLDGRLDAFIANGRVQFVAEPAGTDDLYAEPNQLLRQATPGRFADRGDDAGEAVRVQDNSRAAAFGDYDNDGDLDILIVNNGGRARLLRNDAPRRGAFLAVRVLDAHGRDAYGAHVTVYRGERRWADEVRAAYSYCATNDPRLHFGLGPGEEPIDRIDVRWPDGTTRSFGPVEAERFVTLRPSGDAAVAAPGTL